MYDTQPPIRDIIRIHQDRVLSGAGSSLAAGGNSLLALYNCAVRSGWRKRIGSPVRYICNELFDVYRGKKPTSVGRCLVLSESHYRLEMQGAQSSYGGPCRKS